MKKIFILGAIFGSALFSACNTARQAERHYQQFKARNREVFALDCSNNFHRDPEYIKGRDSIRIDTVVLPGQVVDCPPADASGKSTVQCPPNKIVTEWKIRVDTVIKPDAAKEESLRLAAERLQTEKATEVAKEKARTNAETQRADKFEKENSKKGKALVLISCIALILGVLKLKKFI